MNTTVADSSQATLAALQAITQQLQKPTPTGERPVANATRAITIDFGDPDATAPDFETFRDQLCPGYESIWRAEVSWDMHEHICKTVRTDKLNLKFKLPASRWTTPMSIEEWWEGFRICNKQMSQWRTKLCAFNVPELLAELVQTPDDMLVILVAWMIRMGKVKPIQGSGVNGGHDVADGTPAWN